MSLRVLLKQFIRDELTDTVQWGLARGEELLTPCYFRLEQCRHKSKKYTQKHLQLRLHLSALLYIALGLDSKQPFTVIQMESAHLKEVDTSQYLLEYL